MNKNDFVILLMPFCTLAVWVWAWTVFTKRRIARGKNRLIAYLIGALAGSVAASGVSSLGMAFLMPDRGDGVSIAMGVGGALMLCAYLGMLRFPKHKAAQSAKAEYKYAPLQPYPQSPSTGDWLVPLAIGLWIGKTWGKDD